MSARRYGARAGDLERGTEVGCGGGERTVEVVWGWVRVVGVSFGILVVMREKGTAIPESQCIGSGIQAIDVKSGCAVEKWCPRRDSNPRSPP
jgi:hypothetical protein